MFREAVNAGNNWYCKQQDPDKSESLLKHFLPLKVECMKGDFYGAAISIF